MPKFTRQLRSPIDRDNFEDFATASELRASQRAAVLDDQPVMSCTGRIEDCASVACPSFFQEAEPRLPRLGAAHMPRPPITNLSRAAQPPRSMHHLTQLLYGKAAAKRGEPWANYSNPYGKAEDWSYGWTQLKQSHLHRVSQLLPHKRIRFAVEVGCFIGGSARAAAHYLQSDAARRIRDGEEGAHQPAPYLCIDTWLGDVGMALGHYLHGFVDKRHGQPLLYHQFLVNMISANLTQTVLPFVAPSLIGGRALEHLRLLADFIYLDAAHEQGETFMELELYWRSLAPGGVIAGDDLNWLPVVHDVALFARVHRLNVSSFNGCHRHWVREHNSYARGRQGAHISAQGASPLASPSEPAGRWGEVCVWYLQKPGAEHQVGLGVSR